ncbi:MAG: hypothetical protein LIP00_12770, partial [Parabacteroides sp.]|nr:hypothetical protein [Parabacteroides sp.]
RDISLLENGKKKFIPTEYIQFLNKKGIDLEGLFNDSLPADVFQKRLAAKLSGQDDDSGRPLPADVGKIVVAGYESADDLIRIPLVDVEAAAGAGSYNGSYTEEVDAVFVPGSMVKKKKPYLGIRIKGDSMAPTLLNGGYLIIRELSRAEWRNIRDGYVYVVVTREGLTYVKRIKNRLSQGFLVCTSDNPDKMAYGNFNLYEEDLYSVWYAEWYFTAKMPNIQEQYYQRLSALENNFDEIREEFLRLSNRVKALKGKEAE